MLETVLYFSDQNRAERFYRDVLGMRPIGRKEGRHSFFRAGDAVFLLFHAETANAPGDPLAHGATGSGHTCFTVDPTEYDRWKDYLEGRGVAILDEKTWGSDEARSFYFRDPEGNLLEIANRDIWPG